ncbi:MAG: hypothetical protein NTZ93_04650 [Candidatus Beckwithbacteria bacterium]|nr:hypothetical protein [Candidatus Beckwithbacteria bacterium]
MFPDRLPEIKRDRIDPELKSDLPGTVSGSTGMSEETAQVYKTVKVSDGNLGQADKLIPA